MVRSWMWKESAFTSTRVAVSHGRGRGSDKFSNPSFLSCISKYDDTGVLLWYIYKGSWSRTEPNLGCTEVTSICAQC